MMHRLLRLHDMKYTWVHAQMHTHTYTHTYTHIHTHTTHSHTHTHTHTHFAFTCMHGRVHTHTHTHTNAHQHTVSCMHAFMYIHTSVHTQVCANILLHCGYAGLFECFVTFVPALDPTLHEISVTTQAYCYHSTCWFITYNQMPGI